jgi:two-component system, OmpR family, sensor histidine kinase MprB
VTLRARIALIAATAVALAVLAASVGLYVATARTLRGTVDQALMDIATGELPAPLDQDFRGGPRIGRYGGAGGTVQVVTAGGIVLTPRTPGQQVDPLPVSRATIEVAAGTRTSFYETVQLGRDDVRILTVPSGTGLAVQLARPLTEVEEALDALRRQLLFASLLGVALAGALGLVVASRAVRPVGELTQLAEQVAATQDLSRRLGSTGQDDEVGRLAAAFDEMLAQLEQARSSQEQLVADASHELRTPLTSLRTNIEVLTEADALTPTERRELIDDVVAQIDEFAHLIGALVELARGETPITTSTRVQLDAVARRAVERLDPDGGRVTLVAQASTVSGDPIALERAVGNLVDNALKYAPGGPVSVEVGPGRVRVRDHGPGICEEDLPHVFDRFYRSSTARGAPGSGLGLAIVRQIATAHDGDVEVANHPDGGAVFTLQLPDAPPPPPTA